MKLNRRYMGGVRTFVTEKESTEVNEDQKHKLSSESPSSTTEYTIQSLGNRDDPLMALRKQVNQQRKGLKRGCDNKNETLAGAHFSRLVRLSALEFQDCKDIIQLYADKRNVQGVRQVVEVMEEHDFEMNSEIELILQSLDSQPSKPITPTETVNSSSKLITYSAEQGTKRQKEEEIVKLAYGDIENLSKLLRLYITFPDSDTSLKPLYLSHILKLCTGLMHKPEYMGHRSVKSVEPHRSDLNEELINKMTLEDGYRYVLNEWLRLGYTVDERVLEHLVGRVDSPQKFVLIVQTLATKFNQPLTLPLLESILNHATGEQAFELALAIVQFGAEMGLKVSWKGFSSLKKIALKSDEFSLHKLAYALSLQTEAIRDIKRGTLHHDERVEMVSPRRKDVVHVKNVFQRTFPETELPDASYYRTKDNLPIGDSTRWIKTSKQWIELLNLGKDPTTGENLMEKFKSDASDKMATFPSFSSLQL